MTTNQHDPKVPTVSVATTKVDAGSYFHAVHVNRGDFPTVALPVYGDRPSAERLAAELRGALADAYLAGTGAEHDCGDAAVPNTGDDETWRAAVVRLNNEAMTLANMTNRMLAADREPERVIWRLYFTRTDAEGNRNDYDAHVIGPPPHNDAAPWRCIPDGVRSAAQYDGLVNEADTVSYAVADLPDVTDYTDAMPRATAGSTTTWHEHETIRRPRQ